MQPTKFGFGQPVTRQEDDGLIRGRGCYVSDLSPDGALHAVVLRSPHAFARFRITDVEAAWRKPGVRLIMTAADTQDLGCLPCAGAPPGTQMTVPPYPVLAHNTVRHVGDAVAYVVADTVEQARDAAETIVVDWQALAPAIDAEQAMKPGAPLVWDDHAQNVAFETSLGDKAGTEAAFENAAHVITLRLTNPRVVANYLDTRGALAEYDERDHRIVLTAPTQGAHLVRDVLADAVLKVRATNLQVITPDVGGGFGTKFFPYREYALTAVAATRLRRPVKWVAERMDHFQADTQGRDNITEAKLALDADGKFLALSVDTVADMGAYLSLFAPFIPVEGSGLLPGLYHFPTCYVRVRGVYTNTVPVDAYRGAGRPEAAYVIERLVDVAARDLGIGRDELRRRNFIAPEAMPYTTPTSKTYDSGEFAAHMQRAQRLADWDGFDTRAAASHENGKLRGIGLASYIEACGALGPESAKLTVEPDGGVTVLIGTQSTGHGHLTAYAQLIADHLGLPPERVRMVQGDTGRIATGGGTGGSSSITVGGVAVREAARRLGENLKQLASDRLEASPGDLEIADGAVQIAGTDRAISFAELAQSTARPDFLTVTENVTPAAATYPNGTHVVEVEVDPATGDVAIDQYVIVDDFGVTLNPLMLAGQVHGGTVQGLGQALLEQTVYDRDSGQLITASLMDYALPRALHVPSFVFETRNIPCVTNPLGVKGAGEAGSIGSCPAIMNAIVDALWRAFRIRHIDMPATPERVWQALQEGRRLHTL
jgi:carbon-monoxide dehydrogenase large subunit